MTCEDGGRTSFPKWSLRRAAVRFMRFGLVPPTLDFPYGQLLGGGPAPKQATWMEAEANSNELKIRVMMLDGSLAESVAIRPLA